MSEKPAFVWGAAGGIGQAMTQRLTVEIASGYTAPLAIARPQGGCRCCPRNDIS
jgi:NAD(P)-dependent dehydrogenase (short-subunit alcohol dehydrogenase family)